MAAAMQQCAAGIERVTSGRAVGLGRKNQMMKGTAVPSRVVGHPGGQRRRRTAARTAGGVMAMAGDVKLTNAAGQKRVVVTGLGVVTALGNDVDEFYEKLLAGESAVSEISGWETPEGLTTVIAGEIKDFDPEGYISKKMARRLDPYISYMIVAAKKALEAGGILHDNEEQLAKLDRARCGCLIGSAMGGMHSFSTATENLIKVGHRKMNPFCIPFAITNMGSALTAMDLKFMGPNYSISSACATGNFCILNSVDHIRNGEADLMLAGASDAAILPSGMGGFAAARALSTRNDDPHAASRPWDVDRDGFVMGEGAGVLCLESLEHALARGATPLAEVMGGSYTCDAHHMTEPHPEGKGVAAAIARALETSGVAAADVNYINAHATSTPAGDMAELKVLQDTFGGNEGVKINSTKSMIGHLLGAASAVEAVACVKAITDGWVHPNCNLDNPEADVDTKLLVGSEKEKITVKAALSNSFGFGGHNSAVLFAPYKA